MKKWHKISLFSCFGCVAAAGVCVVALLGLAFVASLALQPTPVGNVSATLPPHATVDVTDVDRFRNDLMLSPYWKVEKYRAGEFVARARTVAPPWTSQSKGRFLFDFMTDPERPLPEEYKLQNEGIETALAFSDISIRVVFGKPDSREVAIASPGGTVNATIFGSGNGLGPNSTSEVPLPLSRHHEVYAVVRERGADPTRAATFAIIPALMQEMARLAALPATYRVDTVYAPFFDTFFADSHEGGELKQFPGPQDRDTLCGLLRSQPGTEYSGVNIKISHPTICPGEGTRRSSRLQKAEYLGVPHQPGDLLFFLIDDNAVYLSGTHNKRYGTFSGSQSFKGVVEVLNAGGSVLLEGTGNFKGWER